MKRVEVNKEKFVELIDQGLTSQEIADLLNLAYGTVRKRMGEWKIKSKHKKRHSAETKKTMSMKRKEWLNQNPDKHPWKHRDKFKSEPCEILKQKLMDLNIKFEPEYEPLRDKGRYFSIDIAFPEKRIGIEVNGNQHYERNGNLKSYYQKRHDLLAENGWKVYELHYSACFRCEVLDDLILCITNSESKCDFNYEDYRQYLVERKKKISELDPKWRNRPRPHTRKVVQPSKEDLEKLVWEKPTAQMAKDFGVSDSSIGAWCKRCGISKPPRGYWSRLNKKLSPT